MNQNSNYLKLLKCKNNTTTTWSKDILSKWINIWGYCVCFERRVNVQKKSKAEYNNSMLWNLLFSLLITFWLHHLSILFCSSALCWSDKYFPLTVPSLQNMRGCITYDKICELIYHIDAETVYHVYSGPNLRGRGSVD